MKLNYIKAVVIEDEIRNRHYISNLIPSINEKFQIVGEASSVEEGVDLIRNLEPHIAFIDIKMPDGTAFDLLAKLADNLFFEVVFVTGFDEYAIKAFEFNALDYVLKPIDEEKFALTLARAEKRLLASNPSLINHQFLNTISNKGVVNKISVHFKDKVHLLNVEEIESVKSEEGCTVFTLATKEKFISSKHMADFEFILSKFPCFQRINRSVFINVNFITNYSKGSVCIITLQTGDKHEVSRRKKADIIQNLASQKDEAQNNFRLK